MKLQQQSAEALREQWKPVSKRNELLGFFLLQQIESRFVSAGSIGGVAWPKKKFDDGRAILTGRSALLRKSFVSVATERGVNILNDRIYFDTQQNGATIAATKAKALYVPLTDRGASSQRLSGPPAGAARQAYGMRASQSPYRVATRGPKLKADKLFFRPLVQGRFKDGKLQSLGPNGWQDGGKPDFLFLKRVVVPQRKMLPDSPQEKAAARTFIAEVWNPQNQLAS